MLGEFVPTLTTIVGLGGSIIGAGFYLKFVATKANIEGKDATIATLEKQMEVTRSDNDALTKENAELKGENRTLRDIATQTPEIVKLTESVTHLSHSMTTATSQQTKILKTVVSLLEGIKAGK